MTCIQRVKYGKQPLVEVIFQMRFPTVLNINATDPVKFQDEIRDSYPFYRTIVQESDVVVNDSKRSVVKEINHEFISVDKMMKINLTSSFLAISTLSYDRWESFYDSIIRIKQVFEKIYKPVFYTRIGLRYIDVIDRADLGLMDSGWTELIQPAILGIINKANQSTIKQWSVKSEYLYEGSDIATRQLFQLAVKDGQLPPVMVFDCDYFKMGSIQKNTVEELSIVLHEKSSTFLRNAITEVLHEAMKPMPL